MELFRYAMLGVLLVGLLAIIFWKNELEALIRRDAPFGANEQKNVKRYRLLHQCDRLLMLHAILCSLVIFASFALPHLPKFFAR